MRKSNTRERDRARRGDAIGKFIHEDEVPDQECILHRSCRNAEGFDEKYFEYKRNEKRITDDSPVFAEGALLPLRRNLFVLMWRLFYTGQWILRKKIEAR